MKYTIEELKEAFENKGSECTHSSAPNTLIRDRIPREHCGQEPLKNLR